MKIEAAVLQFNVLTQDKPGNLLRAERLLEQAAAEGAQLLVLPELWSTGYEPAALAQEAEDVNGPSLSLVRRVAREAKVWIVGGSIAQRKQGKIYNTAFVADPEGQIRQKYRKTHLFTRTGEDLSFSGGDQWAGFEYQQAGESCQIGLAICYDLYFPELFRNLALRGARIFALPAGWPCRYISEFDLFCRSRAGENRCYLLAANYSGGAYCGHSQIISPEGEVLAYLGKGEGIVRFGLDLDIFRDPPWHDNLKDRQPFIDEIDNNLL